MTQDVWFTSVLATKKRSNVFTRYTHFYISISIMRNQDKSINVRVSKTLINKLKKLNINVSAEVRDLLEKLVAKDAKAKLFKKRLR